MSKQLHISTEEDYLRAHVTVIVSESTGELGAFYFLKQHTTRLWELFTNRVEAGPAAQKRRIISTALNAC